MFSLNIKIIFSVIIALLLPALVSAYNMHEPIIIRQSIEGNSVSNPLIIEGYEITNPEGPCIFVENVGHVVVRNNYIHDCGTEISAELIANNPRDDDCVGMGTEFMTTGALDLFRIDSAKIYNNKIINNDYSIRVEGHNKQIQNVDIYDNKVYNTHRNHFIWVKDGNNVNIYNNDVRHNGLGEFFDNAALLRILDGEDLGCGDGRSQGIAVHTCNKVKIYDNYVLNSSSDGIGIMGDPKSMSSGVEIYNNEVVENGEQGVWLAGAQNVKIYKNKVIKSKHRIDEQGGSSGIMLETNAFDVEIYENEVYYSDMYGISMTAGSNINIHDNDLHHNGDGGVGIMHLGYIGQEGIENITIKNNNIHDNRRCAIGIDNDYFEMILVEGNTFRNNGGNPIHHSDYSDSDFSLHLEDWVVNSINVFSVNPSYKFEDLIIGNNVGYPAEENEKVGTLNRDTVKNIEENHVTTVEKDNHDSIIGNNVGYPAEENEKVGTLNRDTVKNIEENHVTTVEKDNHDSIIDELIESWQAILLVFIILCLIIGITIYRKKKQKI